MFKEWMFYLFKVAMFALLIGGVVSVLIQGWFWRFVANNWEAIAIGFMLGSMKR